MSKSNDVTLLGVLDGIVTKSHHVDWSISKVGGLPTSFPDCSEKLSFKCKNCGKNLVLVTQIYCPLEESKFHRSLLIYACITRTCWNNSSSWLAIRKQFLSQKKLQTSTPSKQDRRSHDAWLDMEEDWNNTDDNASSSDKNFPSSSWDVKITNCSLEAANLSLDDYCPDFEENSSIADLSLEKSLIEEVDKGNVVVCGGSMLTDDKPNWLTDKSCILNIGDNFQPVFKEYFVSVISEPSSNDTAENRHVDKLMKEYEMTSNSTTSNESKCEGYEKTDVKHGDKIFHKFQKKISLHRDQIIRYSWNGNPLFISEIRDKEAANCMYCSSKMVFELQLMPPLVNFLQLINLDIDVSPIEFGVVIVRTCEKSCWSPNNPYRQEHILVQADPDEQLYNNMMK